MTRYMCLLCSSDYLEHQTIIADDRKRCICLNCWNIIKKVDLNIEKIKQEEIVLCSVCFGECEMNTEYDGSAVCKNPN